MKDLREILSFSSLYALWQFPFVEKKLKPVLEYIDTKQTRSIIDIGCGPGNTAYVFKQMDYLGIDISEEYISSAQKSYKDQSNLSFIAADACELGFIEDNKFDYVLINSLMHHLSDPQVSQLMSHARRVVKSSGEIHIVDLVLPEQNGIPRFLAQKDRGEFPRSVSDWLKLLGVREGLDSFYPFNLTLLSVTLWKLLYVRIVSRDDAGDHL